MSSAMPDFSGYWRLVKCDNLDGYLRVRSDVGSRDSDMNGPTEPPGLPRAECSPPRSEVQTCLSSSAAQCKCTVCVACMLRHHGTTVAVRQPLST